MKFPAYKAAGLSFRRYLISVALTCIPTPVVMCPLPCEVGGGLGWGASAASGKSLTLPHGFLLSEAVATFGCTLKDKQPHPSPPLLSQGRGQIPASLVPLNLNTLCEAHS